jgi:hypothetical protein
MQLLTSPLSQFNGWQVFAAGLTGTAGGGAGYLGTRALLKACFAAGTPLLTPDGCKPIEEFRVGDLVLSRAEEDADGPVVAKEVLEVFVRTGRVLHLHVGGQVIRTTAEHPFWVQGEGWLPAGQLRVGDLLVGHDGRWVEVEDVLDTGEYETVYNLRIADYHTYFVGCEEWGFSVWAHNQYDNIKEYVEGGKKVVVVGDGDMSFGRALARRGNLQGERLIVTNGDQFADPAAVQQWQGTRTNLYEGTVRELRGRGAQVHTDVDARMLHTRPELAGADTIIWNNPFAHQHGDGMPHTPLSIQRNQMLLTEFLDSARLTLADNGTVLLTVPSRHPYVGSNTSPGWNIPAVARDAGFRVQDVRHFNPADFPGYTVNNSVSGGQVNFQSGTTFVLQPR